MENHLALIVKLGDTVPIPCRSCGKKLIPFVVKEGNHTLTCPDCKEATRIEVTCVGQSCRIRTARPS